ncbi:hypothetical protein L9F63_016663, partial [Diploptera punctata]
IRNFPPLIEFSQSYEIRINFLTYTRAFSNRFKFCSIVHLFNLGDLGHTAWFQSRVQVLVRSLRSHPQWRDRVREDEDNSSTSSSPTPQRRPLQLGRSLANRWQQYSPAPLRRLRRLFSTSSERNLSEQEDGWESDNDDLRKQQQRLKAAGVEGSTSLSDTSPLLHSVSPIATTSSYVESIRDRKVDDIGSTLDSSHEKSYIEELSTAEHSQKVLHIHSSNNDLDTSYDFNIEKDIPHSKSLTSLRTLPYDAQETEVFESTRTTSNFSKDYYVLTVETDEDEKIVDGEACEMTQWRHEDNATHVVNGEKTPVNECKASESDDLLSKGLPENKSDSLNSLLNKKLDEEVAFLLSSDSVEDSASVIEIRPSEKSENADVISVIDMAQNVEVESLSKLDDSVKSMAVIGVVTKSELGTCSVDEIDKVAILSPPDIVLELPQTNDQLPPSSEMTALNTITTTAATDSHRLPKLQLDISTAPCSQSAARKSPVTVQEWVDSLPLHNR